MSDTYLSLIFVGRNDNYGGDFKSRLQMCVTNAFEKLNAFGVRSEIIFVNYNPLDVELPILKFIDWPSSTDTVKVRVIDVPGTFHTQFLKSGKRKPVPVLEYVAKNIGIRRASGEYILVMNPDIIIPDEIYQCFSEKKLMKQVYYRVDRVDHKSQWTGLRPDVSGLHKTSFRIYLKGFQYPINGYTFSKLWLLRMFNRFRIYFHLELIVALKWLFVLIGWKPNPHNAEFRYHCNVSGDFMLMNREKWFSLRGYPDSTYMSLHTDALMVIMAAVSGLKEFVFAEPIFHKDHERRFDAYDDRVSEFREVYLAFQAKAQKMITRNRPIIENDTDWGLSGVRLPEQIT